MFEPGKKKTLHDYGITLAERLMLAVFAPIAKIVRMAWGFSEFEAWMIVRRTGIERGYDRHDMALACYLCYHDWVMVRFYVE